MATCHQSCLAPEILHLDIKYNTESDFLIPRRRLPPSASIFKSDLTFSISFEITSFQRVSPLFSSKSMASAAIFGASMKKCMCVFEIFNISLLHRRDDEISLTKHMSNPPIVCWLVINTMCYLILCSFNRITFLHIR